MVVVPAEMGRINKRTFLARLQRLGVASRAELAKSLGLSQPTIGKIAQELLEVGVLEDVGLQEAQDNGQASPNGAMTARLGRPGRLLRLNRSKSRFLGIQLGVTETSLTSLAIGAQVEDHWAVHVPTPDSAKQWVQQLRRAARRIQPRSFWGVLVSVPGIVDERTGHILFSPNLHWTERAEVSRLVQEVWPNPVLLVQEERALALGHQAVNPLEEDFLLVDIGDGVGGAAIVGGKLYANPLPLSGELGHTPVLGNTRPCGCGAVGCVETLISHRGLLQSFTEAGGPGPHTWPALVRHLTAQGLKPWLATALEATAVVVAGALNVLGLRRVVITGALRDMPPTVREYLDSAIVKGAMWARFGQVECHHVPRRRAAGLVAAGLDRLVIPMTGQTQGERLKQENAGGPAAARSSPPSINKQSIH